MSIIVVAFVVLLAAVLQSIIPPVAWTGYAAWPLLPGVVLYYALMRDRGTMLTAAILGGLIEDGLGLMPLGYSSFCYCMVGLIAVQFKEIVLVREWTTHVIFGAAACSGITVALFLLLFKDDMIPFNAPWILLRIVGAMLLGAVLTPFVFNGIQSLDRMVGNIEESET